MARGRNGRDHKAAGRPDGGQYEEKAGQGSDDDLEVPTTAESVAPDEGWWASLEDDPEAAGPWWERKDRMTPELETMRRTVVEAHSRKEAADILNGLPELARCAVIRNLPFARKTAVADLAPDPDGQSDPATMAAGLPYTADDAKAGLLIGRAAKGDVRAAAALAFHGSDGDREWLAKSPMAEHPSVRAALKAVSEDDDEPEKDGDRVKKTESGDKDGKAGDEKTAASKDDGTEPADPVADALKELEGVGDVMKARAIIASRPRGVRVAVVRAQPFDRISMLADLTGDPDKARGYHSMLDGLPYTKDFPKDRLRDMASRGDVRAAAALAAYGDDDARRWLSTLPVGDHRAVQAGPETRRQSERRSRGVQAGFKTRGQGGGQGHGIQAGGEGRRSPFVPEWLVHRPPSRAEATQASVPGAYEGRLTAIKDDLVGRLDQMAGGVPSVTFSPACRGGGFLLKNPIRTEWNRP